MLDLALAIALLLSFLKLGEIALRPHQKKWLQAHVESLTLRLDYRTERYSTWLRVLRKTSDLALIGISIITLLASAPLIDSSNERVVFLGLFMVLASLYMATAAGVWHRAPEFLDWAGVDKLTFRSVCKIFGLFFLVSAMTVLRFLGRNEGSVYEIMSVFLGIFLLLYFFAHPGRYMAWNAFSGIATLVALTVLVWFLVAGLARGLVGIMWRVVEYPSGAWAALLFLATGLLGVIKVYVQ